MTGVLMLCIFADTPVVSPEGKSRTGGLPLAPLTSVMDRNGETLFTPVVELLLLTRRRRFTGPDEDFLPGEEFRTRRINRLSQHVDMPAFVGKTGRFQPQMRTVVALPPNQQRILTCFFRDSPRLATANSIRTPSSRLAM